MGKRVIPIWWSDRNGMIINHEKGYMNSILYNMQTESVRAIFLMTGIRLWEEQHKGLTYEQIIDNFSVGLFAK